MADDSWYRDLLPPEALERERERRRFERQIEDARSEFRAALGRRDPLPETEPPVIPRRGASGRRW